MTQPIQATASSVQKPESELGKLLLRLVEAVACSEPQAFKDINVMAAIKQADLITFRDENEPQPVPPAPTPISVDDLAEKMIDAHCASRGNADDRWLAVARVALQHTSPGVQLPTRDRKQLALNIRACGNPIVNYNVYNVADWLLSLPSSPPIDKRAIVVEYLEQQIKRRSHGFTIVTLIAELRRELSQPGDGKPTY